MVYTFYPRFDTTIYEDYPNKNTGLDENLEIRKVTSGGHIYESKILMSFDVNEINTFLTNNSLNINNVSMSLALNAYELTNLPFTFNIVANPVAQSWTNGNGRYTLAINNGATWSSGSLPWTSSLSTKLEYNTVYGGASYVTGSTTSQSFDYSPSIQVNIPIKPIVDKWISGSISNNGFLISFNHNEVTGSSFPDASIKFHSNDTHTIYSPYVKLSWVDATYSTSLDTIAYSEMPIVYTRNFKAVYKENVKCRIQLGARPAFPRPSFSQNTTYATIKALPANSYYRILDEHTNEVIEDYSNFTKISCDTNGNYFDFYSTNLYPERFYKFEIKSNFSGFEEYFTSNEFTFKIVS